MKPRNVSVSLYNAGNGEIKVWCVSFSLKGSVNGNLEAEKKFKKNLERFLSQVEIPDDLIG